MKKVQDHYFHRAKKEGFAARSVYKLEQIDRKRRLLRAGMRVLDLGSAPGSWLQYAAGKVGSGGIVVGCDLTPLTGRIPLPVTVVQADVFDEKAGALLATGAPYDLVLSDLAPKTTGVPSADAARSARNRAIAPGQVATTPSATIRSCESTTHKQVSFIETSSPTYSSMAVLLRSMRLIHAEAAVLTTNILPWRAATSPVRNRASTPCCFRESGIGGRP